MKLPDKNEEEEVEYDSPINCYEQPETADSSASKATVIFNEEGNVIFWSKNAERIFGWTAKEAEGKHFSFILYKQFSEVFQKEVMRPTLLNKPVGIAQFTILLGLRKNGSKVQLSISADRWAFKGEKSVVVYFKQIKECDTNMHKYESANYNLLKLMEKNVFEGIAIVDKNGMVVYMNHATEILLNRKSEDLIGNYFGLPMVMGKYINIEIIKPDRSVRNVEMRSAEVTYKDEKAFFISLRDVTEKEILKAKLEELAFRDKLTGLFNRSGFMFLAEQQIKYAKRIHHDSCLCEMTDVALLFIDVDGLKYVNDNFGHKRGDSLLCTVADLLKSTFREADIVGRIGGDEFVVFAITTDSKSLIGRLMRNLELYNSGKGKGADPISFSVGMAMYDFEAGGSITDLIDEADNLMYKQKRIRHKNRQD